MAVAENPEHRRVSLRLKRTIGLGVILALVGAGCSSGGQLGATALLKQSKSLQSDAAEGALLAQDAASGKATRIYTRAHSSDLYRAASEAEVVLSAASTEPALEPMRRRLVVLARQIGADLKRLGGASKDEDRALARQLQSGAETSRKIGEELA
jgi:hypothetical protein